MLRFLIIKPKLLVIKYNMTAEKITVTIPHELKERLVFVKDELKTSMSAIYK